VYELIELIKLLGYRIDIGIWEWENRVPGWVLCVLRREKIKIRNEIGVFIFMYV
jgi:hypothetical protein